MTYTASGNSSSPTEDSIALILAGGAGTRLHSLTRHHAKPAIHFAGKYRAIDFSLSNCIHSGIKRVSIMTQYKSHSLNLHIQQGWGFLRPEMNEYIELVPAQQRTGNQWYEGTADAVYQNIDIIAAQNPRYVVVLAGDHIYKMDYRPMLQQHVRSQSDMTIACLEVPLTEAQEFGVLETDDTQRIIGFEEKPRIPKPLPGQPAQALASMGIYIFNWLFLRKILILDAANPRSQHDFGKDIIPHWIHHAHLSAYRFHTASNDTAGYWRDIGTIDAYFDAHMDLLQKNPPLNLYDNTWPILSYSPTLPPAQFVHDDDNRRGMAIDSMVCDGVVITGARVKKSVISTNVHIDSYSQLERCVILPNVEIGRHCRLRNVIVDRDCKIPAGTVIGYDAMHDRDLYLVSPKGITLIADDPLTHSMVNVA